MSAETIIGALGPYGIKPTGRDRYRAICPSCGERNPNTLSIGVTAEGSVLIKCFKLGCSVEEITAALGLAVTDLFPAQPTHAAPLKRRRMITDRQALDQLHDEAQFVALVAGNIAFGVTITDDERAQCMTAAGRIAWLRDEVMA